MMMLMNDADDAANEAIYLQNCLGGQGTYR